MGYSLFLFLFPIPYSQFHIHIPFSIPFPIPIPNPSINTFSILAAGLDYDLSRHRERSHIESNVLVRS